jgi:hypothetical protein
MKYHLQYKVFIGQAPGAVFKKPLMILFNLILPQIHNTKTKKFLSLTIRAPAQNMIARSW